jgi:membrane protease YdiL (CAAX protease family)
MHFVKGLFWNTEQRRLRALWRLLLQIVLLLVLMIIVQIALGLAFVLVMVSQGGLPLDQLGQPGAAAMILDLVSQSPVWRVIFALGVFVAMVASVWLAGRFLDLRRFADFGLHMGRRWWGDLGFGLFLGAFLMLAIFLVELAAGWLTVSGTLVTRNPNAAFLPAILPSAIVFLAVGIYEELFSRGYQLQNMAEGLNGRLMGPRAAVVVAALLSSAVFGILHAANPNASVISTFNIFLAGALLMALGLILTGELAIPIGIHITWNFFQGNVFGFPVSGGDFGWATFIAVEQGGPDLWTGGAFGPEAGLVGVAAMILGAALTIVWVRWRHGSLRLHTELAQTPEREQRQEIGD